MDHMALLFGLVVSELRRRLALVALTGDLLGGGPGAHEPGAHPGDGRQGHGNELLPGGLRVPLPDPTPAPRAAFSL